MQFPRLARAISVVAALCLVAACRGGDEAHSPATKITGGTSAERTFLRRFVEHVNDPDLLDVRLLPVRRLANYPRFRSRPHMWLSFTIRDREVIAKVRSEWNALLIGGAARDAWSPKLTNVRPVGGVGLNILRAAGEREGQGSFPVQPPPLLRVRPTTREIATQVIKRNAPAARLTVDSLAFTEPLGIAPILTVQVPDARRYVAEGNARVARLLQRLINPPRIDGFFIEVRSEGGDLVEVVAYSKRLNYATGWTPPEFR